MSRALQCKGGWHDVTLRYDDNAPDVVVATLKLVNVPTEPKLPQTGDNANPLLYPWNWCTCTYYRCWSRTSWKKEKE